MKLIVDSNIIMSALIKDSKTREIILQSGFTFYHPKGALLNFVKYKNELIEKSKLNEKDFEKLFEIVIEKINLIETEIFINKLNEAMNLIGKVDIEDVPFIALALSLENDGIWSEDKHYKKQDQIRIFNSYELIEKMKEMYD